MKLKDNLTLRKVGTDYIIVDPSKESVDMTKIYSLNPTAAWLWEQLQGVEFTDESAADLLLNHYEVEREQALQDVRKVVDFFTNQGLLAE